MVLIISDEFEVTTNDVIDWLVYYNIPYIRINETTKVTLSQIYLNNTDEVNIGLTLNDDFHKNKKISISEIQSVWYRRGDINIFTPTPAINSFSDKELKKIYSHLRLAKNELSYFIYMLLKRKKHINTFYDNDINKNHTLLLAKECGLKIPETLITSEKTRLSNISSDKEVITKAIRFCAILMPGKVLSGGTEVLDNNTKDEVPHTFFPSLFQEKLEKKYEIRSFFIHGRFYSTAIFSQLDEKTKIDFRNYNHEKPNRVVPYKLPENIELKLDKLMKKLEINCGSIDIVVTKKNDFVFLEVNPIGQFAQVSVPGNYYIEKYISRFLNN